MTEQLRLHLPAPRGLVWCVHCLGFHDRQFHDRAWRKYYEGDRDAMAVYTRPPKRSAADLRFLLRALKNPDPDVRELAHAILTERFSAGVEETVLYDGLRLFKKRD